VNKVKDVEARFDKMAAFQGAALPRTKFKVLVKELLRTHGNVAEGGMPSEQVRRR
jgi:hypothetical protein